MSGKFHGILCYSLFCKLLCMYAKVAAVLLQYKVADNLEP